MSINNQAVNKIFNDLDEFRDFCRFEGYVFNEAHLYKNDKEPWQAFQKYKNFIKAKNRIKAKKNNA